MNDFENRWSTTRLNDGSKFISSHRQRCEQKLWCLHRQACRNTHFISSHRQSCDKHVCSFHQSLRRTTKHPGLEQQEELGREAIVADPELTEDHEEATEVHPGAGKLDRIVDGDAPGEVRKTLMCLRTLLSRRWQPHHVACP